jgi:hypothetical protein
MLNLKNTFFYLTNSETISIARSGNKKKSFRIHNTTYAADWFGLSRNSKKTRPKKLLNSDFKMRSL